MFLHGCLKNTKSILVALKKKKKKMTDSLYDDGNFYL